MGWNDDSLYNVEGYNLPLVYRAIYPPSSVYIGTRLAAGINSAPAQGYWWVNATACTEESRV